MAAARRDEILVFMTSNDSKCAECGEEVIRSGMITLRRDKGALCLACADLDHLVFLGSGDAALTRRARKYSTLSAIVLRWSKARKRYERQGILVEEDAVDKAEEECLSDADVRARRREREVERRNEADELYVERFAAAVREHYPNCPPATAERIARHACRRYSGRIGRSAAAKELGTHAIELAVTAHVRHTETDYDTLLMQGIDRTDARMEIQPRLRAVLDTWRVGEIEPKPRL